LSVSDEFAQVPSEHKRERAHPISGRGTSNKMMKRERFLSEITKSILLPYEASEVYEEEIFGEFENQFEVEYFNRFLALIGKEEIRARCSCWHYHVHTNKWTLLSLLKRLKFEMLQFDFYDGYIYTLCRSVKDG